MNKNFIDMDYNKLSKRDKWTLMKYIKNYNLMILYAYQLKKGKSNISDKALSEYLNDFQNSDIYNPRFGKISIHTIKFKICQLAYYNFGYKDKINNINYFVFSPLGNLLLKYIDDETKTNRIFLCMLLGMPFKHPFNKMSHEFNIYPFRLFFKLLLDDRLEEKIYLDEFFSIIVFLKTINNSEYDKLVETIINFRKLNKNKIINNFQQNSYVEDLLGNSLHECTYTFGILRDAGIVDYFDSNMTFGILKHGGGRSSDTPTGKRKYKEVFIKIKDNLKLFLSNLLDSYPYYIKPVNTDLNEIRTEYIKRIYNFYPIELLSEINESSSDQQYLKQILDITKQITPLSRNKYKGDFSKFEDILCESFNLFNDVEAEKIAVSGTTDIDCKYIITEDDSKKFDVEAKSTSKKLNQINAKRLEEHRKQVNSKYTIIITPNFINIVLNDIENTNNVIIKSHCFENFLYQYANSNGVRNLSYEPLDDIILKNMSKDISNIIDQYVSQNFGIPA